MSRIVQYSLVFSIGVYILCDYTKYSLVLDALAPAPARAHARGRVVNIPEGGAA